MMTRRAVLVYLWVAVLLALGAEAGAQTTSAPALYRLESGSSFNRGCYPPCDCPLFSTPDIRGTYTLTFDHQDPLFTWYRVDDVNWTVTIDGTDTRITGWGSYRRGGEVALQQQMTLELSVGDAPKEIFDSGLVGGGESFPSVNVTISVNGMVCLDTVIGIKSKPVPATDITAYTLNHSRYDAGCFGPCVCPIREWPIRGTFKLVDLPSATTPVRREWAVADVSWATISPALPLERHFSGFGSYQIVEVGPTSKQRMVLDLEELNSGTESRFDSGMVIGGTEFPAIDIDLSVNGFYCNDKAFFLHAAPQSSRQKIRRQAD
jgi:hypothetical protein